MEELGLSQREVDRAGVLAEVVAGRLCQRRAAEVLGLSTRQVKRLVRAYRTQGVGAIRSKKRGRPSNRRHSDVLRERVLALATERYHDFGPTLLAEYLQREHAILLSPETLRQWLIRAGRWKARSQRRSTHRPRSRRPRFGELIQIDGSPHDWFEGRAPRCTMIVFIDDATSQVVHARLVPAETTEAYFDGIHEHLSRYGRPLAYYSDRHAIFRVNREDVKAAPTQVERALQTLEIDLICAHSPQAKGRVERAHQTFQDRFTKVLRLEGISDIAVANARLQAYLVEHNHRFAKPAFDPEDAHRPVTQSTDELRRILSPHHTRTVGRSGAVQFGQQILQVARSHHHRSLGKQLTVIVNQGSIELWKRETAVPFTALDRRLWRAQVKDRKALDAALDQRRSKPTRNVTKPAANHPWRLDRIGQAARL
ncbi:MAG TPA: ISNCY family transposase [Burkholderiaceae bacterium]|nr:ISNCY family transposase [Burkholderiaceae bacterium]